MKSWDLVHHALGLRPEQRAIKTICLGNVVVRGPVSAVRTSHQTPFDSVRLALTGQTVSPVSDTAFVKRWYSAGGDDPTVILRDPAIVDETMTTADEGEPIIGWRFTISGSLSDLKRNEIGGGTPFVGQFIYDRSNPARDTDQYPDQQIEMNAWGLPIIIYIFPVFQGGGGLAITTYKKGDNAHFKIASPNGLALSVQAQAVHRANAIMQQDLSCLFGTDDAVSELTALTSQASKPPCTCTCNCFGRSTTL